MSLHGQDYYSSSGVAYAYINPPEIFTIWPTNGVKNGGTSIFILGRRMRNITLCLFAHTESVKKMSVPAFLLSDGREKCISLPVAEESFFTLELSQNGQDYLFSGMKYAYRSLPRLSWLNPLIDSNRGGQRVVFGSVFIDNSDLT